MKVVFISHSPEFGGAEKSLFDLVYDLKERGINCQLVCPKEGQLSENLAKVGIPVYFHDVPWWGHLSHYISLSARKKLYESSKDFLRFFIKIKPDLVYSNTITIPTPSIAAKILKIPHIWHLHEFGDVDHEINFLLDKKGRSRFIYENSEKVILNSQAIRKYYEFSQQKQKSIVAYYHIQIKNYEEKNSHQEIKKGVVRFLLAGQIQPGKGQLEAIRAAGELKKRGCDNFIISFLGRINSQDYFQRLIDTAKKLNLSKNINFEGYKKNPFGHFLSSDAVLMCSKNEAFGRVTVEAMLLGKPVIGTNSGGTKEIIENEKTGLLYEPENHIELANKMELLLKNKTLREDLGKKAREYSKKKFSKDGYGKKIYEIISELLSLKKDKEGITEQKKYPHSSCKKIDKIINKEIDKISGSTKKILFEDFFRLVKRTKIEVRSLLNF